MSFAAVFWNWPPIPPNTAWLLDRIVLKSGACPMLKPLPVASLAN